MIMEQKCRRDETICQECNRWHIRKDGNGGECLFEFYKTVKKVVAEVINEHPKMKNEDKLTKLTEEKLKTIPPANQREVPDDCPYKTEHLVYECCENETPSRSN